MVEPRIVRNLIKRVARTRLGIDTAVDNPRHPCLHDCSGTHGAGLECHIKRAVFESPVSKDDCSHLQCNDLRVCRRIPELNAAVVRGSDHFAIMNDHTADGDFILRFGENRFLECEFHEVFVRRSHPSDRIQAMKEMPAMPVTISRLAP